MDALKRFRLWRCEKGAELVEFALSFPLLLLVVLGIVDFGLLFQRYQVLTNAAREGARVAVLPGYASADAVTRVNQYLLGTGLAAATPTVGAPQTVAIGAGLCMVVVPVTVTFNHNFLFLGGIGSYFGGSFGTKTLTATATMRSEVAASACP